MTAPPDTLCLKGIKNPPDYHAILFMIEHYSSNAPSMHTAMKPACWSLRFSNSLLNNILFFRWQNLTHATFLFMVHNNYSITGHPNLCQMMHEIPRVLALNQGLCSFGGNELLLVERGFTVFPPQEEPVLHSSPALDSQAAPCIFPSLHSASPPGWFWPSSGSSSGSPPSSATS